jgi:hypothetical protein
MDIAGSEMVTSELASALKDSSNEVAIFTLHKGKFANHIIETQGIPVFTTNQRDHEALLKFDPEVLHIQHWPTYLWLRRIGITAPAVFGFLGVVPSVENPPPLLEGSHAISWAVSEEVKNNVASLPGWGIQEPSIIRNWVAPEKISEPNAQTSTSEKKNRLIVVSNHFPQEYTDLLTQSCAELKLELVHFGLPENPKTLDPSDFKEAFAVVSIGRTVLLAASLGIPALMLDHFGSDGWLTPENIFTVRERNFSGRTQGFKPGPVDIRGLLSSPPTPDQVTEVQKIVLNEHQITIAITSLKELYQRAIDTHPEPIFGKGAEYVSELIEGSLTLGGFTFALQTERDSLQTERDSLQTERDSLQTERDSLQTERDSLLADRAQIFASNSWRLTRPLRYISELVQGLRRFRS